jgi:hypothetical protein
MSDSKSFFKREAVITMLFQIALPALGLLFVLVMLLGRWLSR